MVGRVRVWVCVALLAGWLGWRAGPALAQTPTPLMYWQYAAGEVLAPYRAGKAPEWRVLLGPSPIVMPRFEGSKQYRIQPGVALDVRYRERLFFGTGEGLGYDVLRGPDHRAGIALGYDTGRSDHPDHIHGLGDIGFAPEARLYGEYVFRPMIVGHAVPVTFSANVRKAIGGYDGVSGDLGLYMPVAGSEAERFFVFVGPGVAFGNGRTMDSFFSVDSRQSRQSGLRVYDADGGLRSAGFGLNAGWFFTPHWMVAGQAGARRMLGDAADSPVVQDKWQYAGSLTIAYMWF